MGISTVFAFHVDLALDQLDKVVKIQLMTFITMMLITDRRRINLFIWAIVISLGFYGVKGGIFTALTGGSYHVMGPPRSFIGGNNEIALALIMTIPLMRYLQLQAKTKLVRYGLILSIAITLIAILGSQSRGALLGLIAMILFLIWKSPRRLTLFALFAVVLSLGFAFMPKHWHVRMDSIAKYQLDTSAMGRVNAWRFATNLGLAHPLTGGGFDAFQSDLFAIYAPDPENVHDAHSIYFQVLGEQGFVGLALFLLLGWFAWRSCTGAIKQVGHNPDTEWIAILARMLQVSIVGYAVGGAFLGLAYFDFYYSLLAIVVLIKAQLTVYTEKELRSDTATIAPTS
jgi:probable O-glycosylation ligase (exosortase A-associated)